jgi:hypothetical protein
MDWIIALLAGLAGAAVLAVIVLSLDEIKDYARSWWGTGTIVIIDPATDAELERIAASKGSKTYKRFVYNKATGDRKLVESNSISPELAYRSRIEVYVS